MSIASAHFITNKRAARFPLFVRHGVVVLAMLLLCAADGIAGSALEDFFSSPRIAPLEIVVTGEEGPAWLRIWQDARRLAATGDHAAAVVAYSRLLDLKSDAVDPSWEYASLLLALKQFDRAAEQLETLVEQFPDRVDYLNGLGYAMQKKGYHGRAVELFDRATGQDPANIVALTGLGEGLLSLGNPGRALPRLEALNERRVDDVDLQKRLVRLYLDLGLAAKAQPLALRLAERADADPSDWKLAARAHDQGGDEDVVARCWQRVVAVLPADREGHSWLASYYEKRERWQAALVHLRALLDADEDNVDLVARIAEGFLRAGNPAEAALFFEKYLTLRPEDKEVLGRLVALYGELGRDGDTLAALDRYLALEPVPATAKLRQAASLHESAGRHHEAVALYRRLLERDPDDAEVLAALARVLLAVGDHDGTLAAWAHLARISPDSTTVYRSMMALLDRLGRHDELVNVLAEINRREPADMEVALRLAAALVARQDLAGAERVFLPVAKRPLDHPDLLRLRARVFEGLSMPDHALNDYLALANAGAATPELRVTCLELAAALGRMSLTTTLLKQDGDDSLSPEYLLRIANGFRDGCHYETAHNLYRQLLDSTEEPELRRRLLLSFAQSYQQQHLVFEAEQIFRLALLEHPADVEILAGLVELQIEAGYAGEAALWLEQLESLSASHEAEAGGENAGRWLTRLLEGRLLNHTGKFSAARKRMRVLLETMADNGGGAALFFNGRSLAGLTGLELARACLGLEEYDEAERQCRLVMERDAGDLDSRVLLQKIVAARRDDARLADVRSGLLASSGRDLGRMMQLTDAYRRAGMKQDMIDSAELAVAMGADSFAARFRLAQVLTVAGNHHQALTAVNEVLRDFPESTVVQVLGARTAFILGLDETALSYCDTILADQPYRADMQLLKARIFWRHPGWGESLPVYENYLIPAVHDLLIEQAQGEGLFLPAESEVSLWQRLTFAPPAKDLFVDRMMTPAFAVEPGNLALKKIAASLFSRYKWQQRFAGELAARRLVEQRDDFQAADLFRQLAERYPEDQSLLFDLAGIHSRLDQLGDEALLYKRLAEIDPHYPGLQEAIERNRLKRQPRVTAAYRYATEDGWDGYQSIRKHAFDTGAWASMQPGNDVEVTLSTIGYSSADADDSMRSQRAFVSFDKNLLDRFDLTLGGGVESLDGDYADAGLIECGLKGRVSDRLRGEVSYERDVVDDTVASLSRAIMAENLRAGLFLGILPRLLTGGDYDYTTYSDGNNMMGYSFWASYILLPDPTSLQVRFNYRFMDTEEGGNDRGPLLDDGFAADDHPYWTPRNYWKNGYAVLWTHKLSADTLERGTPSYYSAEYLVEYDANGHMLQTVRGGFSLELSNNWMLESAARLVLSDEYRAKDLSLSAVYRW